MSASHRFHLLLPSELDSRLREFAASSGLSLGAATRFLISEALDGRKEPGAEPGVSLAALVAAEHTLLMVASILPEGERRMRSLSAPAAVAAAERLSQIRDQLPAGEEPA